MSKHARVGKQESRSKCECMSKREKGREWNEVKQGGGERGRQKKKKKKVSEKHREKAKIGEK